MSTVYHYKFFCITENTYVDTWGETAPTLCPHNTSDTIDLNSMVIVEKITTDNVIIADGTAGYYQATSMVIDVPTMTPGAIFTYDKTFPFDIYIWTNSFYSSSDMVNDSFSIVVGPDTAIGYNTVIGNIGDTTLYVSATVFSSGYLGNGVEMSIFNGVNYQKIGRISSYNATAGTITFETALTNTYNPGSGVLLNLHIVKDQVIGAANQFYIFGRKGIATRKVPKNTVIRFKYMNSSGAAKTLYFDMEYNYA